MYRMQHDERLPAQGQTTEAKLQDSLLKRTDVDGTVNTTSGKYGPYLSPQFPPNPYNGLRTVTVATADAAVDNASGWFYNSSTGTIRANNTGNSSDGTAFSQL